MDGARANCQVIAPFSSRSSAKRLDHAALEVHGRYLIEWKCVWRGCPEGGRAVIIVMSPMKVVAFLDFRRANWNDGVD